MKQLGKSIAALAAGALILISCLEELEDVDKIGGAAFEPVLEFPLVNSEFTLRDFLVEGNSSARIVDKNGVMTLIYDDSLVTATAETFFLVPDQASPTININGGEFALPPGASVSLNRNQTFAFNAAPGQELDSVQIKSGDLKLNIQSTFQANVSVTIQIPSLETNAGSTFEQTIVLNGPNSANPSIDISGYTLKLIDGGNPNRLRLSIAATITSTGQAVTLAQNLSVNFTLEDLEFRGMFGDLGSLAFPLTADSLNVDIFDNAEGSGSFQLLSPTVSLTLSNSFGLPLGFDINEFVAYRPLEPPVFLSGTALSAPLNPYLVNAPNYNEIGQYKRSNISLTGANSNLPELLSYLPKYLGYQFNLELNPGSASTKNFVLDSSRLTIGVHLELPFHGSVSGLTLQRDYEFGGLGIDDVERSTVHLKTVNGSPVDMSVQVFFVDEGGTVLDSLFTNPKILEAAPVDVNGFSSGSSTFETEVKLSQSKVERIEQAERLVIRAGVVTANDGNTPVRFSAEDEFNVVIGVKTKMSYKPL